MLYPLPARRAASPLPGMILCSRVTPSVRGNTGMAPCRGPVRATLPAETAGGRYYSQEELARIRYDLKHGVNRVLHVASFDRPISNDRYTIEDFGLSSGPRKYLLVAGRTS